MKNPRTKTTNSVCLLIAAGILLVALFRPAMVEVAQKIWTSM